MRADAVTFGAELHDACGRQELAQLWPWGHGGCELHLWMNEGMHAITRACGPRLLAVAHRDGKQQILMWILSTLEVRRGQSHE